MSTKRMNYTDAAGYCASNMLAGYLAVPESAEETAFIEAWVVTIFTNVYTAQEWEKSRFALQFSWPRAEGFQIFYGHVCSITI